MHDAFQRACFLSIDPVVSMYAVTDRNPCRFGVRWIVATILGNTVICGVFVLSVFPCAHSSVVKAL
ncbi:hypothetical protein RSSM_00507 [Rhodopirellula sallentina SM41]|uniref:Uncharacterized protein n=1 Tax=Rhodopirellula sallentina SM41 TaxID=1263870 RepID=M5U9G1_9BACT|nr:hypothetical protein RSSM_00507 [Rhodopirellula sallentina SM41]